jgi:CRP-like cAMP-binding protein
VFKEGEVGNTFYIIEEGECECLKSQDEGGYELIR